MADSKPFAPTQSRLQRARREGDAPRAPELVAAASFGGAFATAVAITPAVAAAVRSALENAVRGTIAGASFAVAAACALAVLVAGASGAALVATALAGGIRVVALKVDFTRLSPAGGMKRMLSRDAVLTAARATIAAAIVGAAIVPPVRELFHGVLARAGPQDVAALAVRGAERSIFAALAVGAVLGFLDALLERAKWRRRLRMSFDEMKQDVKQNEGDPLLRGRRRARHRELAQRSISRLREAAFVVTNPTHIAVGLAYKPPGIAVPRVVVRALDDVAQVVITRARQLRIPVVQEALVARTLFAASDIDAYITRDCYVAVAQIVAALTRDGLLE